MTECCARRFEVRPEEFLTPSPPRVRVRPHCRSDQAVLRVVQRQHEMPFLGCIDQPEFIRGIRRCQEEVELAVTCGPTDLDLAVRTTIEGRSVKQVSIEEGILGFVESQSESTQGRCRPSAVMTFIRLECRASRFEVNLEKFLQPCHHHRSGLAVSKHLKNSRVGCRVIIGDSRPYPLELVRWSLWID